MQFRPEVEGLRGVAVGLVVLYHFGLAPFSRGLFGVDIFFVISGYLITRILARELEGGSFSLIEFYRRRVVRILPALLAMVVLTCAAGALILLPLEIRSLGLGAAAAAGFVSNLLFLATTGYFDVSEVKPLIHTWSLGVEEQFYILYPLLLFAAWRWARPWLVPLLWLVTAASLALAWYLSINRPELSFYLLPARAWELGIGAIAALGGLPRLRSALVRDLLAALGLVAMIAILRAPIAGSPVPAAILPCAGAALLLAYGEGGGTARLLSFAPLRWLGRISYSLYLWHWPLLDLYRAQAASAPGRIESALLAVAILAAGYLSWRFVELPFQRRFRHGGDPGRVVAGGVAVCAVVAAAGVGLALAAPYVRPVPPPVARLADYAVYKQSPAFAYQFGPAECRDGTIDFDFERCVRPEPGRRNVVVMGDSHAAHLWRAIAEHFPKDRVMLASSTGCRPLLDTRGRPRCRAMFERVMRDAIAAHRVQAVVLAGLWSPGEDRPLGDTIAAIRAQGVAVTVIGPVARYRASVPRLAALGQLRGDPGLAARQALPEVAATDARIRAAAESAGAHYYSLYDAECPAGRCRPLTRQGVPVHFDYAHLTLDGARELVERLPRP